MAKVGLYAITFENVGGKKSVRDFAFDNEDKCIDFCKAFNLVSKKSKITQVMKCIFPLPTSNIAQTDDDSAGCVTMKVMYESIRGDLFNCSIPFCYNFSRTELKSFLMYIKDFKEINNVLIDKIV